MTNLAKILLFLKNYEAEDQKEAEDVKMIISLISQHENIFQRSCLEAHITASALVVNQKNKKILLHNHKKLNKWLQFGGHADGEEDLSIVTMKEAQEETGLSDLSFIYSNQGKPTPIDIDVQVIPKIENIEKHLHLDFRFLIETSEVEVPKPPTEESQQLSFFSFEEIEAIKDKLDSSLLRLIKKAEKLI